MLKTYLMALEYFILTHAKGLFAVVAVMMLMSSGMAIYNHDDQWLSNAVISGLLFLLAFFVPNFDD